jgi:heptaprenylglyceryl phosphate synthase
MGGSFMNPALFDLSLKTAVEDFNFTVTAYLTTFGLPPIRNTNKNIAIYWMSMWNANNLFYLRDWLTNNSIIANEKSIETIPTAYVFDERGDIKTAAWLAQPNLVPREKPEISLAIALAMQNCGFRFYILAGGSGCKLIPPSEHISLLSKRTELFLIPTSGIRTASHSKELFLAGADALHLGNMIESKAGLDILEKIIDESRKHPGKDFL